MFYTDRQMEILEFLRRYRRMRGRSPTLEEIAQQFGVSKVTIHDHVRQLEKKGAVRKEPRLARSLEIIDPEFLDPPAGEAGGGETLPVTVLGRIAAGEPLEAVEMPETVDLAELLPMGREHYALRVRGDSMIDEGIHSGDLVIIERRSTADDGEVVVALLEDEQATLKRLYRAERNGKPIFRLQPANERLKPIYTERLEIRGVVIGVVRRYPAWPDG
ncbi:MAG: transcriptional repressor LexA [Planctomycetota bacterium]